MKLFSPVSLAVLMCILVSGGNCRPRKLIQRHTIAYMVYTYAPLCVFGSHADLILAYTRRELPENLLARKCADNKAIPEYLAVGSCNLT